MFPWEASEIHKTTLSKRIQMAVSGNETGNKTL